MFPLIPVDKVLARLSVTSDIEVEKALQSALEGAYTHLETALQTQLTRNDHVDLFFIDPSVYRPYGGTFRLKLNNGFVVAAGLGLETSDSVFGTTWVTSTTQYLLNAQKGFLDLPSDMAGKSIKVSYEAGFVYDPNDLDSTYAAIPEWLKEAAMAQAIKLMSMQQLGDEKPVIAKMYKMLDDHKLFMLDSRLRTSSRAIPAVNKP